MSMSMSSGNLLNIQPTDLKFPFELYKQTSSCLQLTNKTDEYVAFKVKTTNPKKYCVRPNVGIVLPGTICDVTVTMQALGEAPQDMQSKDKFLVESVTAPKGATLKDITPKMFNKQSGKVLEAFKVGVIYVPVNPLVPEVSSPKASAVENGSQGTCLLDAVSNSLLMSTSGGDLLDIQPSELEFPFELNKQSSCPLRLTNKTDKYVAFKVKTTIPKKYCVRPNTGIVLPGTTCDVTVTVQAQKEAPQDTQCKDKFKIQSVQAPYGATLKDITPEMFDKESGKDVKEFKMSVIHVLEKASYVENGSQGTSLFDHVSNPQLTSVSGGHLLNIQPTALKFPLELEKQSSCSLQLSGHLLNIQDQPTALKFPFELKKQSSCSLQLANKTKEFVAFKVKTTTPKKYCVRPNAGIVLPGTTCDVTVTMQASKEASQDMLCKDKFLLQSFIAPKGATGNFTPEMFDNECGKVVNEIKMGVIYVPVDPLVPEGSPPWESGVENGTRGSPLFDAVDNKTVKVVKEFKLEVIYVPVNPVVPEGSSPGAPGVENGSQGTSLFDAKKRSTELQQRTKSKNEEKNILGKFFDILDKAFGSRQREKALMAGYVMLASEDTKLETDDELLNKEIAKLQSDKGRLQTDIELLKKEKDSLHKILNEEKDEFIRFAIHEVNESINERLKTLSENEKVVARDTQELQEEFIKQMVSEKVTRNITEREKTLSEILQTDIELLKKEKDTLHKALMEEKADFLSSSLL